MATVDRIDPAYVPWSPSTAGFTSDVDRATDDYVGKHRRPGFRGLNVMRMFHTAKHRRR